MNALASGGPIVGLNLARNNKIMKFISILAQA